MSNFRNGLMTGVASLALAGMAGVASAQEELTTQGTFSNGGPAEFATGTPPSSFSLRDNASAELDLNESVDLTFGEIGQISFNYTIDSGTVGPSAPRIFFGGPNYSNLVVLRLDQMSPFLGAGAGASGTFTVDLGGKGEGTFERSGALANAEGSGTYATYDQIPDSVLAQDIDIIGLVVDKTDLKISFQNYSIQTVAPVPEPAALGLLGLGALGLMRRRRA